VLDDDEVTALWRAAGRTNYPFGPLVRMLLLTGQRRSEVAEARWREFDLDKKLWSIAIARMKGKAAHVVPLTDDVLALLRSLPRFARGDYVFSTTFGTSPTNGFSKYKARLDREMRAHKNDLAPYVLYDIRRTMRTHLSALPVPDLVRELVIGHAKPGLHKVYDQHAYLDEKRHALELWAKRLRDIVEPDNVVVLRAQGG
jgi:integrase